MGRNWISIFEVLLFEIISIIINNIGREEEIVYIIKYILACIRSG